jgi:WD40 repeat protein
VQPERDGAAQKTPPGDGASNATVQQAIEQFIELHATGQGPDPATFAGRFPEDVRKDVLLQCREFLAFDGLLGHQEWQPTPAKETQGRSFGDFVIQEELGRGGMGVVYLAQQKSLNRRVALKVMASGLTLSKRHVERFRREAAAAAQLHHPAIVAVHSLSEVDGTFALAMDYVAGRNLADILDDLRLANGDSPTTIEGTLGLAPEKGYVAECAMFVAELASALAVAHQGGVVHRDLKPRNLMLDDRRQVRLLDFGLAKSLGEGSISMSGEITGTAHYMSPEQTLAKRVEIDHRADIWALGVILYELLALRRPFDGKNLQQVVYVICFQEPVPRDLVTICQKALEKDPKKRYPTAAEFEADLQRFLRWEPVHAKPASATTRVLKWMRRHRTESLLAGVLLVGGVVMLGLSWHRDAQADELLTAAARAEESGDFERAQGLATQALALRNDEVTRARLKSYGQAQQTRRAEASIKSYESATLREHDREGAIRTALDAVDLSASLETRSAVLAAMGSGSMARPLLGEVDGKLPRLVGSRWSPDGSTVLLFGFGGHASLWDPASARRLALLTGHPAQATIVDAAWLEPDRLATVAIDRTLRFWRRSTATLERTIKLDGVPSFLHPDAKGKRILVTTYSTETKTYQAQVFDTPGGTPLAPAVAHAQLFVAAVLDPKGELAATCGGAEVKVWHADTGVAAFADIPVRGRVHALEFGLAGQVLAIACEHEVRFVHTASGQVVGTIAHSKDVYSMAFDESGKRLVTGSGDLTARVWDLVSNDSGHTLQLTESATLTGHATAVRHIGFTRDGQFALTATGEPTGALSVFDVDTGRGATGTRLHHFEAGPSIGHAELSPDGQSVLALAGVQRPIVWDLGGARGVLTIRQSGWAGALAFAPSGTHLATGGSDERLRLWSTATGGLVWTSVDLGQPQTCLDVDAAGERIASTGRRDGAVHVLRLDDGERLFDLTGHGKGHAVVRFARDGKHLLSAGKAATSESAGSAILWNLNDRSRAVELSRPRPIVAADLAPDGSLLATVDETEAVVRLWSMPDRQPRGELRGHSGPITAVRFDNDGSTLLTTSEDRSARLWRVDGTLRSMLQANQPLRSGAFSRDGTTVLVCGSGSKGEATLWRTVDGTALLRFTGHNGDIDHGCFAPEGGTVATTARDGRVCLWPTDPVPVARRLLPSPAPTGATTSGK